MRALLQRVSQARVSVDQGIVGEIGAGLLVFLGLRRTDSDDKLPWLIDKLLKLRLFSDREGKMNLSLLDTEGSLLIVSQFTLYGNCVKGRRPSLIEAMPPQEALPLYLELIEKLREKLGRERVEVGKFGAKMEVSLVNDGPVTFLLEK